MKLVATIALLTLSSCMSVPAAQVATAGSPPEAAPEQQVSLYLGQRSFSDEDFWIPNEDQGTFAVEYSHESPTDVVGWEAGLALSADESSLGADTWTGTTGELYAGVRKSFGNAKIRPYIGGGLSFIKAGWDSDLFGSDTDSSIAGYLHGGVQFLASRSFAIGLDLRAGFGSSVTLMGADGDADYLQGALTLGWRF